MAETTKATRTEKDHLRVYYWYMPLRFRADGSVEGKKGGSWGLILTARQWADTLKLWRGQA